MLCIDVAMVFTLGGSFPLVGNASQALRWGQQRLESIRFALLCWTSCQNFSWCFNKSTINSAIKVLFLFLFFYIHQSFLYEVLKKIFFYFGIAAWFMKFLRNPFSRLGKIGSICSNTFDCLNWIKYCSMIL